MILNFVVKTMLMMMITKTHHNINQPFIFFIWIKWMNESTIKLKSIHPQTLNSISKKRDFGEKKRWQNDDKYTKQSYDDDDWWENFFFCRENILSFFSNENHWENWNDDQLKMIITIMMIIMMVKRNKTTTAIFQYLFYFSFFGAIFMQQLQHYLCNKKNCLKIFVNFESNIFWENKGGEWGESNSHFQMIHFTPKKFKLTFKYPKFEFEIIILKIRKLPWSHAHTQRHYSILFHSLNSKNSMNWHQQRRKCQLK